jgi:hypothetical protein
MLKHCSKNKDLTEWNEWREKNPKCDINLEGAKFIGWYLAGAKFDVADFREKTGEPHYPCISVHLEGAYFYETVLRNAWFNDAHLEGARFYRADVRGASLRGIVDTSTLIWKCKVNRYHNKPNAGTDAGSVPLDSIRIDPPTQQLLEYNIRRRNWGNWYNEHTKLRWPVKAFWWVSDYGLSTVRIVCVFLGFAIAFAVVYWLWGLAAPPGIVENLFADREGKPIEWRLVRAIYFSVVTMTTLGFGDMCANPHSVWGHVVLSLQVILGYVLLGALVTRFAVLFTAGGPRGRFADEKGAFTRAKEWVQNKFGKKNPR